MDFEEYNKLYGNLNSKKDVQKYLDLGYDWRLLDTLMSQKACRQAMKNHYKVDKKGGVLLSRWSNGASFTDIGRYYKYPAFLIMMMVLKESGIGKKEFWNMVEDPEKVKNKRIRKEMLQVLEEDYAYGPEALKKQKERGEWGEDNLHKWLEAQNIGYRTEDDLRGLDGFTKTPDCLLDEPMMFEEKKIFWIESKASFGDNKEFRKNSKGQLIPYTELFGPGVVVYWPGYLNDLQPAEGITLEDIGILEKRLQPLE